MLIFRVFVVISVLCLFGTCFASAEDAATEETPGQVVEGKVKSNIPFKESNDINSGTILHIVIVLIFVCVLAVAVTYGLKRLMYADYLSGESTKQKRIKLVESRRIAPKTFFYIVVIDEKEYLVAQSGDNINILQHN